MTDMTLYLIIALTPLAGCLLAGLFGNTIGRRGAHTVTILGVAVSAVLSAYVLCGFIDGSRAKFDENVYTWLTMNGLDFSVGFLVDSLTALMMVVVTSVSLMVHIYTIGYMADEEVGYQRFFSYISLFTFSMLMLIMSNNFIQLFFGWEAVGLVSYLLIGFYFKRDSAIFANLKAFLVNRVGDFGFVLGIGLVLAYFGGSLRYADVFAYLPNVVGSTLFGWDLITITCLLLFVGAMGKSAQFPLHVWLPDSMEGPTPISALIHAATMVTAGLFMVSRMSPMYELSTTALSVIMVIGAITALFMGFLGTIQNDIKRVVAYSTLSQLGYMTVALGVSAYSVAMFHVMTHAFFKALLFLAAGSVIIGMHHDQDMRNMGGLRKYMPITWFTMLLGNLALIGTPLFSGFYSKDSIIEAVHASNLPGSGFAYFAVLASVFVTAFYAFRQYFIVFHGKERWREAKHDHHDDHNHEAGHHHHHHEGGEVEEYGIGTFVYYRRKPFDLVGFDEFIATQWPSTVIRCKGICWFKDEPKTCYVFEQAGRQMGLRNAGQWYATMPEKELEALKAREEGLLFLTQYTELADLGTYTSAQPVSFEYSPPGASNLPVNIILMPEK